MLKSLFTRAVAAGLTCAVCTTALSPVQAKTMRPQLHGKHWMAVTGKPLAATAGSMIFQQGGNAIDAACAMTAAVSTMWDTLSWGGETTALIYNPNTGKVIAIDAIGIAPTGATPEFFKGKGMKYPPRDGPLAAITPGTPGGIMVMLAEYGTMSLEQVLAPAIALADGYPVEQDLTDMIESQKEKLKPWPASRALFLPHAGQKHEAPNPGEMFRQPDLARMLRKLVAAEKEALAAGKDRKAAIMAAYDRFYRGDVARDFTASVQQLGGLITMEDMDKWQVRIEEPLSVRYRGIDVYKMSGSTQGPVMLQALNILENFDLKSMGYNSTRYIHTVYQAMNLAYADRDRYYGDPASTPRPPMTGLLSKAYAAQRAKLVKADANDPNIGAGDPFKYQKDRNPFASIGGSAPVVDGAMARAAFDATFRLGTSSVQAVDEKGWVVSVTPSGGWVPAVVAGDTGIGLSQRMQQFVLDAKENPYNVVAPGKRPRTTITPSMALKDGKPWLGFSIQGGDTQDQNLLQFFLSKAEFGMTAQEAAEGANIISYQMQNSFGDHKREPGRILLNEAMPPWIRADLVKMGYKPEYAPITSGPLNAIEIDPATGTFWGGIAADGEDYGIAW